MIRPYLRRCKTVLTLSVALLLIVQLIVLTATSSGASVQAEADFAEIDAFVTAQMEESRIPGVTMAIVEDGQVVHSKGFGDAGGGVDVTTQTLFPIGSLTKSMTALSIMQLTEAGTINLDAPAQAYLLWFEVADADASSRITIRHLLNQTSGLSRQTGIELVVERSDASLEETVRSLGSADLNRPVGESYEYSNANFAVLSLVVQEMSGRPFGDYLDANVFAPLGMNTATTSLSEARAQGLTDVHRYWFGMPVADELKELPGHEPAFMSVDDMAAYLTMYLNEGRHNGTQILSAEGIAQMLAPATNEATRPLLGTDFTFRYGMGWFVGPFGTADDANWHLGELPSFNAWMVLLPEQERAVVVMTNADSQFPWPGANEVMSRIPIGIVNLLAGDPAPEGGSLTQFYIGFDLVVLAILAVQVWALVRLIRRPMPIALPLHGLKQGVSFATRTVPLLWEIVLGLGVLAGYPALTGISWSATMMSVPDLTIVLLLVGGLWLVTGVVRSFRLVQAVRASRESPKREDPVGTASPVAHVPAAQ